MLSSTMEEGEAMLRYGDGVLRYWHVVGPARQSFDLDPAVGDMS